MGNSDSELCDKSFFRNLLGLLASFRNRSHVSNSVPDSSDESRGRSERSLRVDTENISSRLQEVGGNAILREMDEEVPENVPQTDKIEQMKNKYEAELPKTREEEFAESTFEWVKTERAGDVSVFKEFRVENGIEYIVFQDNTRVNSALVGDVILKHKFQGEVLGGFDNAFEKVPVPQPHAVPSAPRTVVSSRPVALDSPVLSILEKSKKKKKKIQFDFLMEVPSSEVLSIVKENFDASEDELFDYFVSKIDKKKFVSSIISSINK